MKRQRGFANLENPAGIIVGLLFLALLVGIIVAIAGHHGRHTQRTKLVKTKSHRIYVENDDGSCFEFLQDGASSASDIDLPKAGSSSFKLPSGSWVKASPPQEDEVADEEEASVEESDGQPEADAAGDVGADSDSSGAADSGGDSGGDGGGDGGGDD